MMAAEPPTRAGTPHPTTVLHVVNTLEGGGMERMLLTLLERFQEPTLRHAVVTLREPGSLARRLPSHVPCYSLNSRRRSLSTPMKLAELIRRNAPAIVHARGVGCWFDAALATALARSGLGAFAPLLLGFHGVEQSKPFASKHRLLARMGLALGARFASVSYSGADLLHRELAIPRDRIDVLPNGVDLKRFSGCGGAQRAKTRAELQIAPDAFVVTTVGSLTSVKRHDLLIAAAKQLSHEIANLTVLVTGDGPLRAQLTRQASEVGLGSIVRFLGAREDIPAILAASDLYVCTSGSEGMSNAILEALAAGLPVVATAVGDNPRLIRDRVDGVLIQPGSSAALTQAIRELAADGALRQRFAAAARLRANEFALASCIPRYEELYGRLTANRLERDNFRAVVIPPNPELSACVVKGNAQGHVLHQTGMHPV